MLDTECMVPYKEISNVGGVERNIKIFKPMHKVTLKNFICHVKGVKGSVHIYINRMKPLPQYVHIDTAVASSFFIT